MATLVSRKAAHLNFEVIEDFEAGIELAGFEVKSIKQGRGSLEGAFVTLGGGEAFLVNMYLPPYQAGNTPDSYDPERPRRLLLHKQEINELAGYEHQKGLTIVPFSVYTKGATVKVRIVVARGRKKHDKRQLIKEREEKRRMDREMKQSYAE